MKKLVIFLFVLGFSVTAFAQEVKKELPLQVGVSGIVYGTNYKAVDKDADGDYTAARIRPLFNFTDGNIEAVVKLEMDATFGKTGTDTKSSENVGVGSDKKSVEIVNAFVKSKVDGIDGLTLKAGIASHEFPLIWGDNAPLAHINYANALTDVTLMYIKVSEGDNNNSKDDSQIYVGDAKVKFADSSLRGGVFAFQTKESAVDAIYRDSTGFIYGLSLNLVMGTVGLDAAGAYAKGKDKITPTKYAAFAGDIAPYIKLDPFKITAFFTIVSGDDDTTDGKDTSFIDATIDGRGDKGAGAGINNFRLYIIEDAGSFTTNSDVANAGKYGNTFGYMAYGLSVDGTFGKFTAKLQGAYVQAQKVASGMKKDMGIEFDANVGYALTKTSTLYVEGAYLKAGKFYDSVSFSTASTTWAAAQANTTGEKQNAQYLNVGITYSL